jgi:hypothetical protein
VKIGNPGLAFSLYGDGERICRLDFETISSKYNYLLFVSQAETENVLREALDKPGVTIELGGKEQMGNLSPAPAGRSTNSRGQSHA